MSHFLRGLVHNGESAGSRQQPAARLCQRGPRCHTASKLHLAERFKADLGSVYPANERTLPITLLFLFPAGDDDDEQQRNRHPGEPIITLRRFA